MDDDSRNALAWLVAVLAEARTARTPCDRDMDDMGHCGQCNAAYASTRSDSRYCSNACRQAAYRQRKDTP